MKMRLIMSLTAVVFVSILHAQEADGADKPGQASLNPDFQIASGLPQSSTQTVPENTGVDPCRKAEADGFMDAKLKHPTLSYVAGATAGGCLFGLLGGGVAWLIANNSSPRPPKDLLPADQELSGCYAKGYTREARKRNTDSVIFGCVAGGVFAIIILLVSSS